MLYRTIVATILVLWLMPSQVLANGTEIPKIAVFSGPRATIQSSPPLVTSEKARLKHGLQSIVQSEGSSNFYDHLVPQRLAKAVEVLIEVHTAHPLEKDAAEFFG